MDEKEFYFKRNRYELVSSDIYNQIRKNQLDMVVSMAIGNYDPLEIRGMLKLIGKTDEWKADFEKLNAKRLNK